MEQGVKSNVCPSGNGRHETLIGNFGNLVAHSSLFTFHRELPLLDAVSIAVTGCRFSLPFGPAKSLIVEYGLLQFRGPPIWLLLISVHCEALSTLQPSGRYFVEVYMSYMTYMSNKSCFSSRKARCYPLLRPLLLDVTMLLLQKTNPNPNH